MNNESDIKNELDFVYESTLGRALKLGYPETRARKLAQDAVLNYFLERDAS
jgi:hypothetical protein